jgi:hypothetical protein
MALLNTDLFVIQRPTDDGKHFKLTGQNLKEYIASGDTIVYKGSRDFTQSAQDPSTNGDGVNTGDVYINSHPNAGATGAWGVAIAGEEVNPGDRAIWNGTQWDLIHDVGDAGVVDIIGVEPIEVDDSTPGEPIISVNTALATDATLPADRASRSGVVVGMAVEADVVAADGAASPNPDAAVPAKLLKDTNDTIVEIQEDITEIQLGGGLSALQGDDPIEITTVVTDAVTGATETTVSIKDATTAQKGAVQLQETGSAVATGTDVAATPGYVDAYYLVKDFSSFQDA